LLAGFGVLFAIGIALYKLATTSDATASASRNVPAPVEEPKAPTAVATSSDAAAAAPELKHGPLTPPALVERVNLPTKDEEIEYVDGRPVPVASVQVLRAATIPTDNAIRQCVLDSGLKEVTGQVVTTYIVAKKKDKNGVATTQVEDTGFEEEGTTITNAALIECLHKTAYKMTFPETKSSVAVWARRRIDLDKGVLASNYVFEWGRIR